MKVTVVFAPVPQVGVIRVGRYRTYWRGHRPSVGTTGPADTPVQSNSVETSFATLAATAGAADIPGNLRDLAVASLRT
jgi:hypothetical protein